MSKTAAGTGREGADCASNGSLAVAAIEELYVGRRRELIRVLVDSGSTPVEAEDITQEVFLRTLLHVREKAVPGNLFAWLLASARHALIDRFRRCRHEVAPSSCEWAEIESRISAGCAGADRRLIEQERATRLMRAIHSLGELERQCVLLRSEGVRFREIAERLGIPLRTAAHHTNSAIEKLQRRVRI